MKNDSIRLHPKHGLNPTMKVCFWCGEETGEILLLGAAYEKQAPMRMVTDYEPCEKCKEAFAQGITLMEATETLKGPEPTGNYWVITEEAAKRIFSGNSYEDVLHHKRAFIDREAATKLGFYQNAA